MNWQQVLRDLLHGRGFDIVHWVPELNRPFDVLPLLVEQRLAAGGPFFFVQVGANDGVLDDPLRPLILRHRLPGLMVEPLPDMFEKLQANYAGQPQLRFENAAALREPVSATLHRVLAGANVPEHWHGIASFSRQHLRRQGVADADIETCTVPGGPMKDLLARHGVAEVSLLMVDTEGFDAEVLRSTFDAGVRPALIQYEHCWLEPPLRHATKQMLAAKGYRFLEVCKDTVAVRRDD